MKTIRTLLMVVLAAAAMVACGSKSPSPLSFPLGQPNVAYAKYFIGLSYLAVLASTLPSRDRSRVKLNGSNPSTTNITANCK